eukprot:TRINITY_DN41464_c0_g1_i1.p1 TRINITY_DN41464_c0_g1~~TRINITY_DN41464_c0_g1_i1.p1  ORF type:complete len:412 (-),score=71.72 TRINITY_DN41464_c0_g1_i1:76-1170(-)
MVSRPKIQGRPRFKENEAWFIFKQLLCGLDHLHCHAIIHRDLKLENVLVAGQRTDAQNQLLLNVKLVDFGLSKMIGEGFSEATSTVGSPRYIAPEVLQKGAHDFRADLWSLGILLHLLVDGRYADEAPAKLLQTELGTIISNLNVSMHVQTTLLGLLQLQPEMRTSIDELKRLPFLSAFPLADEHTFKHTKSSESISSEGSETGTPSLKRARRALWLSGNPWQADAEKGKLCMKQTRSRLSEERVHGRVHRWCGRYGWIEPRIPISHAAAAKHCGDVFVHASDVEQGEKITEGAEVEFVVYLDNNGLGAEKCRQVAPLGLKLIDDDLPIVKDALLDKIEKEDERESDGTDDVEALPFQIDVEVM